VPTTTSAARSSSLTRFAWLAVAAAVATIALKTPWERDYPRWPSSGQIKLAFGTWNAALAAADLPWRIVERFWGHKELVGRSS
jgi:hypothetical protein